MFCLEKRGEVWALILGCAALFRYSGLTMIPLLTAWVWLNRPTNGWKMLFAVSLPTLFLFMHDIWVYGEWHFWHMIDFQQEQQSWNAMIHKLCALSSMLVLGGAVVPNLQRRLSFVVGGLFVCLLLTGLLSYTWKLEMGALAWVSVPLGFFCFVSFVVDSVSTKRFWIVCWLLGGVVFGEFALCRNQILASFYCSLLAFDAYEQAEKVLVGIDGCSIGAFGVG